MKGQASVELLVLVGAILVSIASMLYLGMASNEQTVVAQAARDGIENAALALQLEYGCELSATHVGVSHGDITMSIKIRNAPPQGFTWENFRDNVVKPLLREQVLRFVGYALSGNFPEAVGPVSGRYYTYDVENIEVERVVL